MGLLTIMEAYIIGNAIPGSSNSIRPRQHHEHNGRHRKAATAEEAAAAIGAVALVPGSL